MTLFQPREAGSLTQSAHRAVRPALRRFRPLQPVKVRLDGEQPALLFWQGERRQVAAITGPWQSSGYWWDGRSYAADEWDVLLSTPRQALRLRHETPANAWFVAGLYD